jgi:hypothetical protein
LRIENQAASHRQPRSWPLVLGDLCVRALRLYRRQVLLFWAVTAVAGIPYTLLALRPFPGFLIDRAPVTRILTDLVGEFLASFDEAIVIAAAVFLVVDVTADRQPTLPIIFRQVARVLPALAGLSALYVLAVTALVVTIVGVPFAIYYAVAWSVAEPVLLVEQLSPRQALGRSQSLVRGRWWRVCGFLVVVLLISVVGFLPELALLSGDAFRAIPVAANPLTFLLKVLLVTVSNVVLSPLINCLLVLLYFDLRTETGHIEQATMGHSDGFANSL